MSLAKGISNIWLFSTKGSGEEISEANLGQMI